MDAVTGAFSYSGKYIARRLVAQGKEVMTLTGHPQRPNEFQGRVRAMPYRFDDSQALAESLRGVDTLYNTYWVRFNYGDKTYDQAVSNTLRLFEAAQQAGVRRIVHVSITNPDPGSPLPYFSGKARLETALAESGLSYAILRPTVLFSLEDILINNIAYLLRTFPFFAVPGDGEYRLQPVCVEDLADLAVASGAANEACTVDAVGPEIFTFNELLRLIARAIHRPARLVHLPPGLTLPLAGLIGRWQGDVTLTDQEYHGLSANLLVSAQPPTCPTRLSEWLPAHGERLGLAYASEVARHF